MGLETESGPPGARVRSVDANGLELTVVLALEAVVVSTYRATDYLEVK